MTTNIAVAAQIARPTILLFSRASFLPRRKAVLTESAVELTWPRSIGTSPAPGGGLLITTRSTRPSPLTISRPMSD